MGLTREELEACKAFEREWDLLLGGPETIYLREVLAFVTKRLEMAGATLEDVLRYLRAVWAFSDGLEGEGGES